MSRCGLSKPAHIIKGQGYMDISKLTRKTDVVPFIDIEGKVIDEIVLPEPIMPLLSKRVGISESGKYYKGVGSVYACHFTNEIDSKAKLLSKTGILYEENKVTYLNLCGKFGIFNFKHQPVFSDLEGGCGPKEQNLIVMQGKFEKSAIEEIESVISTGIEGHKIYVYRLKEQAGKLTDLCDLIEYVLSNNFCTAWDKNLWADVMSYKYIRDVGDWFESRELGCKIGTVYALLRSLFEKDLYLYCEVLKRMLGVVNCERKLIIYFSALLVRKYNSELFEEKNIDMDTLNSDLFISILSEMFMGKACCHLENDSDYDWVRKEYLSKVEKYAQNIVLMIK